MANEAVGILEEKDPLLTGRRGVQVSNAYVSYIRQPLQH
jgi:hypothetical protein